MANIFDNLNTKQDSSSSTVKSTVAPKTNSVPSNPALNISRIRKNLSIVPPKSIQPFNPQASANENVSAYGIERSASAVLHDLYMEKVAAINADVKFRPHQQRAIDNPNDSMIIAHGVGSGKTLTSIGKFEKMRENGRANKALVVTPSGLRENYGAEGVGKFTNSKYNIVGNSAERQKKIYKGIDPKADYNIMSYEMYRKNPEKYLKESGADTVITDEAHKGKNEGVLTSEALKRARPLYKNHIALTGSLVSNGVSDVLPLVDVVKGGQHNLGKNKRDFEDSFLRRSSADQYKNLSEKRRPVVGFKNQGVLNKELKGVVDYADYDDLKTIADMPDKKINVIKVPLTKEQAKMYRGLMRNNKAMKNMVRNKRLETMKEDEISKAFNGLIESRKLMNSIGAVKPGVSVSESAKITPKTKKLLDDLEQHIKNTPDGQAVLLTNLIKGGADVLEEGLKQRKIPYGKFLGKGNDGVTEETRQQDVRDYKDAKKRAMIVSGAGAEGLSLGNTTWEGVLDPHYNPERMNQMEARGVRAGGLKGRDDRTVAINRYLATMPKKFGIFKSGYKTPDELIYEISRNKDKQNQMFYDLLRKYQEENKNGKKSK